MPNCPALRAREPGEEAWRKVVFVGSDGESIEFRG